MTEHILFYGKGGVGKSTLVSNISVALTEAGFKIMQVGCGPTADSCSTLNGGIAMPTVSELLKKNGSITFDEVVQRGFKDIATLEIGTPEHDGISTAKGIRRVFDALNAELIFERENADFVFYDISGESSFIAYYDILSKLGASRIFVITSADFMSLNSANVIFEKLERFGDSRTPIPFGGLIPNSISSSLEDSFIADFAANTSTNVLSRVPRSLTVRQCELYGKTVVEASPLSNQSFFYRRLAKQIVEELQSHLPNKLPQPLTPDRMRQWGHDWADRLYALENGLVSDGAAI